MTGPPEMPPVPVVLEAAAVRDVAVFAEYPARVRGSREVEIRARVEGVLEARLYDEGDTVAPGSPLFRIEQAPYEVAVRTAEAERATARAALRQAEREWLRTRDLFAQDAVSTRERDAAQGEFELAEARVQAAEARLDQAKLNLGYTEVTAPIPGIAGLKVLSEGALVSPGAILTTVVQHDPIHVFFSMPEPEAHHRRALEGQAPEAHLEVTVLQPGGAALATPGAIDFTSSTVAADTGTVQVRAAFENSAGMLMPGQFVRVRLMINAFAGVVVLPEMVVGEGPSGPQVYLVESGGAVAVARAVKLGPALPEGQVILDGVAPGDRVVVRGQGRLYDGAPVVVSAGEVSR